MDIAIPKGIAWDTSTGELYATEHGPSIFDGPAGGDEVNHIMPGGNYGWPLVSHKEKARRYRRTSYCFYSRGSAGRHAFLHRYSITTIYQHSSLCWS